MEQFRVWIRPLGTCCRVRVEGKTNGVWLQEQLRQAFSLETCEPPHAEDAASCVNFRVRYTSALSRAGFDQLMASIPEVTLMSEPA